MSRVMLEDAVRIDLDGLKVYCVLPGDLGGRFCQHGPPHHPRRRHADHLDAVGADPRRLGDLRAPPVCLHTGMGRTFDRVVA